MSSFFYKFADTILKKYSSTIATAFTALMSYAMFGHELSGNFLIGFLIVLISMHQVRARPQGRVGQRQGGEGIGGRGDARVSERSDCITGGAGAFGGCLQICRD